MGVFALHRIKKFLFIGRDPLPVRSIKRFFRRFRPRQQAGETEGKKLLPIRHIVCVIHEETAETGADKIIFQRQCSGALFFLKPLITGNADDLFNGLSAPETEGDEQVVRRSTDPDLLQQPVEGSHMLLPGCGERFICQKVPE